MNWSSEWRYLALIVVVFFGCFFLPVGTPRFDHAMLESLHLVRWYAREHVLLCLVPAFFIAGAVAVFVSQGAVLRYLGADANKALAYGVASVSGTLLAVCSCTILPLFAGIYRRGAGLGPATAFLYSGPAINVLAIVLTARVLGPEMGIARGIGAVVFSVVIGLLMHLIFRREELERSRGAMMLPDEGERRPLAQSALLFASMVGILVFANWGRPAEPQGLWHAIFAAKWLLTGGFVAVFLLLLAVWYGVAWWKAAAIAAVVVLAQLLLPGHPLLVFGIGVVALSLVLGTAGGEAGTWFAASWDFAKQILPLLLLGVLIAGALLGRVGEEGLVPAAWISAAVGGNSLAANFFAAFAGAFMYFATLTEVPIVQGLIGSGMGKGPALALLLAGPALSLPSMIVTQSVLGTRKTATFVVLVITMATLSGMLYGHVFG